MGAFGNGDERDQRRSKKRGSVNNGARLAGLAGVAQQKVGRADWGTADPRWIAAVVVAASLKGMIVSFKLSRDGGAHGLDLYDNGEKVSLWFNGDADLDLELEKVFTYLETLGQ